MMAAVTWPSTWQEFIAQKQTESFVATALQLDALKILFSDPSVPISEVAALITVDTIKLHDKEPGASDSELWCTLADGIKQLTEYNDKFVELFYEIGRAKLHGNPSLLLTAYWEWWTEWEFSFDDLSSKDPNREQARQGWININAFCAKVSQHRNEFPLLNNLQRVSWIRKVLEKRPWDTYNPAEYADESEEEQTYQCELHNVKVLDGKVPAAAVWFTIDAQAIYELEGDMLGEYEHTKTDWPGKGFSRERFVYWREKFEWISRVEELEEKTRTSANKAAEAMRYVEEANKV